MTDTPGPPNKNSEESIDDSDLGEPIAELKNLSFDPGMEFLPGVRRKINRRQFAQHSVDLSVGGLTVFVREYVSIILESVGGTGTKRK